jgi:hypothetical protein
MHQNNVIPARRRAQAAAVVLVATSALVAGCGSTSATPQRTVAAKAAAATPTFSHPGRIDNRYLPITESTTCVMRGRTEDGTREKSVKTVLKRRETFTVDRKPVKTVIVRDNAYEDGKLIESTLDYFAQADDGSVYYFGERVKNLKNGRIVSTDGTWLYGKDTDRLGVAMPSEPRLGQQWHFEDVPGLTTESNRVEETGLRARVGKRIRTDVIRVQEFIQPEGEVEYKLYASGVGLIAEYPPGGRSFFAGCL